MRGVSTPISAWGLAFLANCLPGTTGENIRAIVSLALYSRRCLGELRRDLALEYAQLQRGILHLAIRN